MKKLVVLPLFLSIVACDAPEKITAKIDYPALSNQGAIDDLQLSSEALTLTQNNAEKVSVDFLKRVMNSLELANQEVSKVAQNNLRPNVTLKPSARTLTVVTASNANCSNSNSSSSGGPKAEALVWDDVNDDDQPLTGDKWFYILNGCINGLNSSVVTGVMEYSGMDDPFNQRGLNQTDTVINNFQYTLDMQIDHLDGASAFYQGMKIVLDRSHNNGAEVTSFVVKENSKFGAKLNDQMYLIHSNTLNATANDDDLTFKFNIDAKYYLTVDNDKNSLQVSTPEELVFDFEFDSVVNGKIINTRLKSGKLKFVGANNSSLVLSVVDETALNVSVDSDGDDVVDANFNTDQFSVFEQSISDFSLLNITGG